MRVMGTSLGRMLGGRKLGLAGLAAAAFVATFAGDHRHVADYLTNEVFARIPDDLSSFLRGCSVLHEFDLALCRAVTDDEGEGLLRHTARALAPAARDGLLGLLTVVTGHRAGHDHGLALHRLRDRDPGLRREPCGVGIAEVQAGLAE